jgi:hypothetical protein
LLKKAFFIALQLYGGWWDKFGPRVVISPASPVLRCATFDLEAVVWRSSEADCARFLKVHLENFIFGVQIRSIERLKFGKLQQNPNSAIEKSHFVGSGGQCGGRGRGRTGRQMHWRRRDLRSDRCRLLRDSNGDHPFTPRRLAEAPKVGSPDKARLADISYVDTGEG